MRVFLTGASGFLASEIALLLRERDDEVVALVRNPGKADRLRRLRCEILSGTLAERAVLAEGMAGCDAVIHCAALFEVGVPQARRRELVETNIKGTRHVLAAALEADVDKLVHVSSVAVFGNTRGAVAQESTEHSGTYASYYEWTKVAAHRIVQRSIQEHGVPGVIVLPGTIYGPGDRSQLGQIMRQFLAGRAPLMLFPDSAGFSLVHVEDVAAGILLALDRAEIGSEYILGGELTTMRAFMRRVAQLAGMPVPERAVPPFVLRRVLPLLGPLAKSFGFPPNVREAVAALDGFTYWANHDKAARELSYRPRSLSEGLRQALQAEARGQQHARASNSFAARAPRANRGPTAPSSARAGRAGGRDRTSRPR